MARMKFLCDADRCIECNACVTACKNEHEVPWGMNRRRVVTINDGKPGERSVSMACMHCTDAPCQAVCPVDCFYTTADGVVLHSKDLCIGCGYCFYACPFGAPQYPKVGNFGSRGKMDKCTFCAGGPEGHSKARMKALVTERIAKGVVWMPYHFAGWFEGVDQRSKYPTGSDPIVLGESVNVLTTYGYDPVTGMQEPKATLCQIAAA